MLPFFLGKNKELYCKRYHLSSGWSTVQKLSAEVSIYTASRGMGNTIFLVAADHRGNLKLRTKTGAAWEESFFHRENKNRRINQIQLVGDYRGTMHLLYFLSSAREEQWWLKHHYFHDNRWRGPGIIDFGGGGNTNHGHAVIDKNNELHIVYNFRERGRTPLCHRTFSLIEKRWSKATILAGGQNNFYPFLGEDADANLHLAWCSGYRKCHTLNYCRKIEEKRLPGQKWLPTIEFPFSATDRIFPFLEIDRRTLKINWITQNILRQRISYDRGSHWEKMPRNMQNRKTLLLALISPTDWNGLPRLQWAAFNRGSSVEHFVEEHLRFRKRNNPVEYSQVDHPAGGRNKTHHFLPPQYDNCLY